MKRSALLIGLNHYADQGISRLECAERDVLELDFYLNRQCEFKTRKLLNEQATKPAITKSIRDLCAGLSAEDLLLIYFGGHGHEDPATGQQVLLPYEVDLRDIEDNLQPALVPVRGLESATARCGATRVFLLDACRTGLRAGAKDSHARFAEAAGRDIEAMAQDARSNPPLVTVCACSPGQRAYELPEVGRGAFSLALQEVWAQYASGDMEFALPGQAVDLLTKRMTALLKEHRRTGRQDPFITANRGTVVLSAGRGIGRRDMATVVCPVDGLRNEPSSTFCCRVCKRDYLCRSHYEEKRRCCQECAVALEAEEREATGPVSVAELPAVMEKALGSAKPEVQALARQVVAQIQAHEQAEAERRAKAAEEAKAQAERQRREEAARRNLPKAAKEQPWENSLGMMFVPVPGTEVLFSIWETRVKDYAAYAQASTGVDALWRKPVFEGVPVTPSEDCPVVNVSWEDAKAFSRWLTEKERAEGRLRPDQEYRLPTDAEWSAAVGLKEPADGTPKEKDMKITNVYPWGTGWPPPKGAGNYAKSNYGSYDDGYATTSPVGSFPANQYGLYDLGGNVWEWCEDWYDSAESKYRALRGGSWRLLESVYLLSSYRAHIPPQDRYEYVGFRCVLGISRR